MIKPVGNRILVQPDAEAETTTGGLFIPHVAQEKPHHGKVISVGDGRTLENGTKVALEVKAGDRVLYGKYTGTEVLLEGQKLLIMLEDDILAVFEGDDGNA